MIDVNHFEEETKKFKKKSPMDEVLDKLNTLEKQVSTQQKTIVNLKKEVDKLNKINITLEKSLKDKIVTEDSFLSVLDDNFWKSKSITSFLDLYGTSVSRLEVLNEQITTKELLFNILKKVDELN